MVNSAIKKIIEPPGHLSDEAKTIWGRLLEEYSIDDAAGLNILRTGLEAFDRAAAARKAIELEGLQVKDRFGQLKPHPLLPAERDARSQWLMAVKALNLDLEPLRDRPGRPGGSYTKQSALEFS